LTLESVSNVTPFELLFKNYVKASHWSSALLNCKDPYLSIFST
jgi:hypothetical protein